MRRGDLGPIAEGDLREDAWTGWSIGRQNPCPGQNPMRQVKVTADRVSIMVFMISILGCRPPTESGIRSLREMPIP